MDFKLLNIARSTVNIIVVCYRVGFGNGSNTSTERQAPNWLAEHRAWTKLILGIGLSLAIERSSALRVVRVALMQSSYWMVVARV
jgi:hypothetical protein